MLNFVKIFWQIKKFSIQERDFDRSVWMAAICYKYPISVVPTNKQLLREKNTCENIQADVPKTEALVRVYANGRTDGHCWIDQARQTDHLYIRFMGSPKFPFGYKSLRDCFTFVRLPKYTISLRNYYKLKFNIRIYINLQKFNTYLPKGCSLSAFGKVSKIST